MLLEELKRTPSIKHDTDENGYEVLDPYGKRVKKFWYETGDKKQAHRNALELLRKLRLETK